MERWRVIEEPKCGVWTGNWGITGVIKLSVNNLKTNYMAKTAAPKYMGSIYTLRTAGMSTMSKVVTEN